MNKLNVPLIFLTYLAVLLYFCIWTFNYFLLSLLLFSCLVAVHRKYFWLFPLLVILGGFWVTIKVQETQLENQPLTQIQDVTPLIDSLEVDGNQLSFRGTSQNRTFQVYYTLKSKNEQTFYRQLASNVSFEIEAELEIPATRANPNGFDFQKYLASQNIYQIVKIKNIKSLKAEPKFDLRVLRKRAILWCQSHFSQPLSNYLTGLLFGYLGKDFDQMSNIYSSLGILHLFALSGMQVNFFLDRLRKILLRLGLRLDHFYLFQLLFSVFYAFITGLSISVLRALLQKNLRLRGLDNFALSFFLLVIFFPKCLLTVGGGLSLFYAFILTMTRLRFKNLSTFKKTIVNSIVLSLGCLPLLVLNFHVFQPLSIPLTFVFSVVFDLFLLPCLLVIFLLSILFGKTLDINFLIVQMEKLIQFVYAIIHRPLVLGTPNLVLFIGLLLVTGLFIDQLKQPKRASLLLLLLVILFYFSKNPISPSITMVNVGQGDSFLLQDTFNRHTILIDTGGRVDFAQKLSWSSRHGQNNAEKYLIPYLHSVGLDSIDYLILTHTDDDHVGDLLAVTKAIKIKQILVDRGALNVVKMVKLLKDSGCPVRYAKLHEKLPIFNSDLEILSNGYTAKGDNDDSIVSYGNFYGCRFLFTGDLEKKGEKQLLLDYPDLKADVLKVGHHGSKTASSEEFIEQIGAKVALISVGKNNLYHHPSPETLETLRKAKCSIYRTDQDGGLRFSKTFQGWNVKW